MRTRTSFAARGQARCSSGLTPQASRIGGFTLIEIIVVVLVFSIMATMAYGGLNTVLKSRAAIEESMERTAAMQRTYLRLRGDFQNLRNRPTRDGFGDLQAPLAANRDGGVSLVRGGWRNPLYLPRSSMERVSYELDDNTLMRASWRALDLAQDAEPVNLPLLEGVQELRWRFLGEGEEWSESWPPERNAAVDENAASHPPPRAVEITLVTRDWGETRFLFRTGVDKPPATFGASTLPPATDQPPAAGDGDKPDPQEPQQPAPGANPSEGGSLVEGSS